MRKLTLMDRVNAGLMAAAGLVAPFASAASFYWGGYTEYAIESGVIAFLIAAFVAWMWWDAKKHTDGY
jgi:hypothetical protein